MSYCLLVCCKSSKLIDLSVLHKFNWLWTRPNYAVRWLICVCRSIVNWLSGNHLLVFRHDLSKFGTQQNDCRSFVIFVELNTKVWRFYLVISSQFGMTLWLFAKFIPSQWTGCIFTWVQSQNRAHQLKHMPKENADAFQPLEMLNIWKHTFALCLISPMANKLMYIIHK